MTTLIGRAVGRGPKAAELVAGVEERFAMARARFPQFMGATAVPAYHTGEQYGCYGPEEARGRFLASLGFVVPPGLAELVVPGGTFVQVSNEQLALLVTTAGRATNPTWTPRRGCRSRRSPAWPRNSLRPLTATPRPR